MVKDRLADMRKLCDIPTLYTDTHTIIDIKANKNEEQIDKILSDYGKIRQWIEQIHGNSEQMKETIQEFSQTFQRSPNIALPASVEKSRMENMSLSQKVYSQMKEFEIDLPKQSDTTILARIKRLHFYSVREEFLSVWQDHERLLLVYEERVKKALARQAIIIDHNITEEETEALMANHSTSLFVGNILQQEANERNKLRELRERHSEMEKIERSIVEVRDMFLRISTLVMEQSPMISLVEYHADQATLNIDKGANKLEKAHALKIRRLKRKTWCLFYLAVFLTIFIVVLLLID